MSRRRAIILFSACLIVLSSLTMAAPAMGKSHLDVLLDGLNSPKAIAAGGHSVFVGQGWAGPPSPVLEYLLTGRHRGTAREITDPIGVVDIAGTPDGAAWAIGSDGILYRAANLGDTPVAVFDILAYQLIDIDEDDQDVPANPGESNPNGLAGLPNGEVLIADAAGNDLLRVNADGQAVTVARWPVELVPSNFPGPSELPAEAVPTTVAIGPDGWAYVGQLIGFPGTPGTAHIWRVNPNAEDAVCSVEVSDPNCSVWRSGFTSIFDIAFAPHSWTLYVYEIAEAGWLAFEAGFEPGGTFPPAVLLKVKGGKTTELLRGQLSQPGGVAVTNGGSVYVTDGMFTGGRLVKVRGN